MQSLAAVHPFFEFEVDILTLQRLIENAVADFGCLQVYSFFFRPCSSACACSIARMFPTYALQAGQKLLLNLASASALFRIDQLENVLPPCNLVCGVRLAAAIFLWMLWVIYRRIVAARKNSNGCCLRRRIPLCKPDKDRAPASSGATGNVL